MKICPKCGNKTFYAPVIVCTTWIMNENGECINCTTKRDVTINGPNENDIWECTKCHYSAEGNEFNTGEDDEEEHYTPSCTHGDYSPSCPWNAPGMSIKDFI